MTEQHWNFSFRMDNFAYFKVPTFGQVSVLSVRASYNPSPPPKCSLMFD